MKLYLEPVEVEKKKAFPNVVNWRGQSYRVLRVEERWLWHGRWWITPGLGGEQRRYFKVAVVSPAGNRAMMEVYEAGSNWVLSQLED